MKTVLYFLIATSFLFAQALPNQKEGMQIDQKIEDIKNSPRPPVPAFSNPFVTTSKPQFAQPRKKNSERKLILSSIIGNSALISNRWYSVGQKIDGWTLEAVFLDFVVLRSGATEKRVAIQESRYRNNNIKKVSVQ